MDNSKRYSLNLEDLKKLLKVLAYSGISALLATLIDLLPQVDVPAGWVWLMPLLNTGLVALKKLFTGKDGVLGLKREV